MVDSPPQIFLVTDVLKDIVAWLEGDLAIGRLWLCGNKSLNNKLAKGAVRRFVGRVSRFVTIQWPSIISKFERLRELKIEYNASYELPPDWAPSLLTLPRSLKKLNLCYKGAFESLCPAILEDPSHFDALEHLSVVYQRNYSHNLGIKLPSQNLPRGLKSFALHLAIISYNFAEDGIYDPRFDLEYMPPGLTSLELSSMAIRVPYNGFKLPTTLTHLRAWNYASKRNTRWMDMISSGESSLTVLHLNAPWSDESMLAQILALPKSLTELKIIGPYSHLFSPSEIRSLPPNLISLSLKRSRTLLKDALPLLPRTLRELDADLPEITASIAQDLPPYLQLSKITSLEILPFLPSPPAAIEISHIDLKEFDTNSLVELPSNVASLTTSDMTINFARKFLPNLTRLRSLMIRDLDLEGGETWNSLFECISDSLTSLNISNLSNLESLFGPAENKFPPNLKILDIRATSTPSFPLNECALSQLPLLEQLHLGMPEKGYTISPSWITRNLSMSLTTLSIFCEFTTDLIECISECCKNLYQMYVTISSEKLGPEEFEFDRTMSWLKSLPRSLSFFRLYSPVSEPLNLDSEYLRYLPPKLERLELEGFRVDPKNAGSLPKSLRELSTSEDSSWFKPIIPSRQGKAKGSLSALEQLLSR